jgi:hypothetical protein
LPWSITPSNTQSKSLNSQYRAWCYSIRSIRNWMLMMDIPKIDFEQMEFIGQPRIFKLWWWISRYSRLLILCQRVPFRGTCVIYCGLLGFPFFIAFSLHCTSTFCRLLVLLITSILKTPVQAPVTLNPQGQTHQLRSEPGIWTRNLWVSSRKCYQLSHWGRPVEQVIGHRSNEFSLHSNNFLSNSV